MLVTTEMVNQYEADQYLDSQVKLAELKAQRFVLLSLIDDLQAEIKSLIQDRIEMGKEIDRLKALMPDA